MTQDNTVVDHLITAVKQLQAGGETLAQLDAEVLQEFMSAVETPVDLSRFQQPAAVVEAEAPSVPQSPTEIQPAAVAEAVPQVQKTPVIQQAPPDKSPGVQEQRQPAPVIPFPAAAAAVQAPVQQSAGRSAAVDVSRLSLKELRKFSITCSSCQSDFDELRNPDEGLDEQASLMIIVEPGGKSAAHMADPFAGQEGDLLRKMITAMKIPLDKVYLCMAHRCTAPGGLKTMVETAPYLKRQIELVKPGAIIVFGSAALNILGLEGNLNRCRGQWQEVDGVPLMATYPASFLMRQPAKKRDAWNDLKQVMARLNL